MKESQQNRKALIDFPIYLNWHVCMCVYLCVSTFIIGIYTNIKFNLFKVLIGKKDVFEIMEKQTKAFYEVPEEFELGDDCYATTVALLHETNNLESFEKDKLHEKTDFKNLFNILQAWSTAAITFATQVYICYMMVGDILAAGTLTEISGSSTTG